MAVNWLAIRNDYINGLGSYRELAEKYGVSVDSIKKKAAAEKWKDARTEYAPMLHQKVQEETAELIAKQEAGRVSKILSIADNIIEKIEQASKELDMAQVTNKKKTKVIAYNNPERADKPTKETIDEREEILAVHSIVDRKGLQQVATALKLVLDITAGSGNDDEGVQIIDDM